MLERPTPGMLATLPIGSVPAADNKRRELFQPRHNFSLERRIWDHLVAEHRRDLSASERKVGATIAHEMHGHPAVNQVPKVRNDLLARPVDDEVPAIDPATAGSTA